jgi:hypothetical protein
MPGHVFLSYSRLDGTYAHRLSDHLAREGLEVWMDATINTGADWLRMIQKKIETCAAFVVLMSSQSEKSDWVLNEILQARKSGRVLMPILLDGEPFMVLNHVQAERVEGGTMPRKSYVDGLKVLIGLVPAGTAQGPGGRPTVLDVTHRAIEAIFGRVDGRSIVEICRQATLAELQALQHELAPVIGPDAPDVLTVKHFIAVQLAESDEADAVGKAAMLFDEVAATRSRMLGPDHSDTDWSKRAASVTWERYDELAHGH